MDRRRTLKGLLGAIALAGAFAFAHPAASDEDAWSAVVAKHGRDPDAKAADEDFAGTVECKECHEDRHKSLKTSFHEVLLDSKKSGSRGCESCHGPGQKHVDDGGDSPMRNPSHTSDLLAPIASAPGKDGAAPRARVVVSVADMNGVCLKCHFEEPKTPGTGKRVTPRHGPWLGWTGQPPGDRSCVSCHTVHVGRAHPAFDEATGRFATLADSVKAGKPVDPKVCAGCHTMSHPQMARSGHAFLMKEGEDHGCDACHGDGRLHVQSRGDPSKIVNPTRQAARGADASCNACHLKGKTVEKWTCAEHSRQGVACITCHDSNAPTGRTLRKPEFELCGSCHLDVQASFRLKNGHKVEKGRVSCSDCHDPHGNTDKVRDRDVRYRACLACHQEKGGPFVFDHGIKREEGCTACHDPHGSVNRRALAYSRMKPMCLQCHPETPHDFKGAEGRKFENCLDCHTEIHGSDANRFFLR